LYSPEFGLRIENRTIAFSAIEHTPHWAAGFCIVPANCGKLEFDLGQGVVGHDFAYRW
jgi:hypothetical protein